MKITLHFLTYIVLFFQSVWAGELIDKTIDLSKAGTVKVENLRGDIQIFGWEKNQVKVSGELDDLTEEFVFETKGEVTVIKVILPKNQRGFQSGSGTDIDIYLPSESRLEFSGVATDLSIEKISGGADLNNVSGDLQIKEVHSYLRVTSVSGDIIIDASSGELDVRTVSGEVQAEIDSQDLSIESVSADVDIRTQDFNEAFISVVSGNIDLAGQLNEGGRIKMNSISGDILLNMEEYINTRFNLNKGPSGKIDTTLAEIKAVDNQSNRRKLEQTLGNGKSRIDMKTISGKLSIKSSR